MRRELKVDVEEIPIPSRDYGRKAHPDEKGTESSQGLLFHLITGTRRKAHPDEKGTESD